MSHVAHQYSRVDFYSSLEVNLSLYYGGVNSNVFVSGALQIFNMYNMLKVIDLSFSKNIFQISGDQLCTISSSLQTDNRFLR